MTSGPSSTRSSAWEQSENRGWQTLAAGGGWVGGGQIPQPVFVGMYTALYIFKWLKKSEEEYFMKHGHCTEGRFQCSLTGFADWLPPVDVSSC